MGLEEHTTADCERFQVDQPATVYRDAPLDAALTVRLWMSEGNPWRNDAMRCHIAQSLGCRPSWGAIHAELIRCNVAAMAGEARP